MIQTLYDIAFRRGGGDPGVKTVVNALSRAAMDHAEVAVRVKAIYYLGHLAELRLGRWSTRSAAQR